MSGFVPTAHPVLRTPTAAQAAAWGEKRWIKELDRREALIENEKKDPLRFGWEPPVWALADALRGKPWVDAEYAARIRKALGFSRAVPVLAILGGNRASKTEYAAKRQMMLIQDKREAIAWACHQTGEDSIAVHHKLFWKFMPPELRRTVKGVKEYIAYKQKTGFSEHKFVLPNGSEETFKQYAMDRENAVQSASIDDWWADELVPPDWIDDLLVRIADRNGSGLITFTPIHGYSPTVRMLQDGAEVVMSQTAFLLPKDGGEPDVARALGFGPSSAAGGGAAGATEGDSADAAESEMRAAHKEGRWSVPTRFELRGPAGGGKGLPPSKGDQAERLVAIEPAVPKGRAFETMPRVMRCVDDNFGILFFWTLDNPFGNPPAVISLTAGKSADFKKERFYGFASRTMSARFPRFSRKVHAVPASAIPEEGTNYFFNDPASGRNFCMHWYRVTKEASFLVQEWPGNYDIPGVGVPGPWAIPDGKKLDGRPGPAQKSFGFGLLRMKQEIARIEGWEDAKRGKAKEKAEGGRRKAEEKSNRESREENAKEEQRDRFGLGGSKRTLVEREVERWDERNGADWRIFERYLDSRAASTPRVEKDRPRTLQTDFEDIGLDFLLTPGDEIEEGVNLINDALDYDPEEPLGFFNKPKFYVCEDCKNAIYSLETWTGADGQKGACKDPVDLMRYFFLSECRYVADDFWKTEGGGHY